MASATAANRPSCSIMVIEATTTSCLFPNGCQSITTREKPIQSSANEILRRKESNTDSALLAAFFNETSAIVKESYVKSADDHLSLLQKDLSVPEVTNRSPTSTTSYRSTTGKESATVVDAFWPISREKFLGSRLGTPFRRRSFSGNTREFVTISSKVSVHPGEIDDAADDKRVHVPSTSQRRLSLDGTGNSADESTLGHDSRGRNDGPVAASPSSSRKIEIPISVLRSRVLGSRHGSPVPSSGTLSGIASPRSPISSGQSPVQASDPVLRADFIIPSLELVGRRHSQIQGYDWLYRSDGKVIPQSGQIRTAATLI